MVELSDNNFDCQINEKSGYFCESLNLKYFAGLIFANSALWKNYTGFFCEN